MKSQITNHKSQIGWRLALICILAFSFWLLAFGYGNAQAVPEFLISWRAINYVPADYQGKIFPIEATPIEIGFDVVESGKIVTLTANEIRWFLDGDLFKSGNGLKTLRLNSKSLDQQIRIVVDNYKGTNLEKIFIIPAQTPKLVINSRLPNLNVGLGKYRLEALPYFFNIFSVQELKFSWTTNGSSLSSDAENPQILNLDFSSEGAPAETAVNVNLIVSNRLNPLELSSKSIELIIK